MNGVNSLIISSIIKPDCLIPSRQSRRSKVSMPIPVMSLPRENKEFTAEVILQKGQVETVATVAQNTGITTNVASSNGAPIISKVLGKRSAICDSILESKTKKQATKRVYSDSAILDRGQVIYDATLEEMKKKHQAPTPQIKNIMRKALMRLDEALISSKGVKVGRYVVVLREEKGVLAIIPKVAKAAIVGKGSSSTVFSRKNLVNGKPVAWKVAAPNQRAYDANRHENSILREIYRRTKEKELKIEGIQKPPKALFDLAEGFGSMFTHYESENLLNKVMKDHNFISVEQKIDAMKQLLSGLVLLSKIGLGHGDIKLENVYLRQENGKYKFYIGDFGGAKFYDKINPKDCKFLEDPFGTISAHYFPADHIRMGTSEILRGSMERFEEIEKKRDVFAMAIVMFSLFFGNMPFELGPNGLANVVEITWVEWLEQSMVPKEIIELLVQMLKKNPDDRPTAEEALDCLQKHAPASY